LSASTSPDALARELLGCCLRGERWPDSLVDALRGSEALIRVVAEGLSDRFEPALCEVYAELFSAAFRLGPDAVARYRRVRAPRPVRAAPPRVVVLSRVTLGADVAVTGAVLDACKRAFPEAEIVLAGPRKNWELFAADPRVGHLPVTYRRGDPLGHWAGLREEASRPGTLVIDTDSRLTQLGLLPVCPEESYRLFESRGYGGDSAAPLSELAARWCEEVFGVSGRPYLAPAERVDTGGDAMIAVSLGVGENAAKRLAAPFRARATCAAGGNRRAHLDRQGRRWRGGRARRTRD
jgi:hypothetical protein